MYIIHFFGKIYELYSYKPKFNSSSAIISLENLKIHIKDHLPAPPFPLNPKRGHLESIYLSIYIGKALALKSFTRLTT